MPGLDTVRRILDEAAGDSSATYQGHGKFWNLPLQELLDVEIYGVRMIAPAPPSHVDERNEDTAEEKASCCGGKVPVAPPRSGPAHPGRGAASGLVKGLRGQFPFNEKHFPRLPWGGQAVPDDAIDLIERWIDEGCPAQGDPADAAGGAEGSVSADARQSTVSVQAPGVFKATAQPTNVYKRASKQLKVRKAIEHLSPLEEEKLRNAFWEMIRLNRFPKDRRNYDYWGRLHGDECQHGWEQFLTWHRMFIYSFEQALQDIDPDVTVPYWDWTNPMYLSGGVPSVLHPEDPALKNKVSGIIPRALRCWINEAAIKRLRDGGKVSAEVIAKLESIRGERFNSGVELFLQAAITEQSDKNAIYPELRRVNPLWYQFRYPGMFYFRNPDGSFDYSKPMGQSGLEQYFHHHYPTAKDVRNILAVDNWRDFGGGPQYDQAFGVLDMDPHNTLHLWSGGVNPNYRPLGCNPARPADPNEPQLGDMFSNLTAGYDPIFWPHHSNVDRIFAQWQRSHPAQRPDDLDAALAGLGFSVRDSLSIGRLGYEYLSDVRIYEVGHDRPLTGFESEGASISEFVRSKPGRVELRLHGIKQPKESYAVRAFVNTPAADAQTPVDGNERFAGHFSIFGHGECIGGPGHCEPIERRDDDRRGRHHNTPYNVRLDITPAVHRLIEQGETDVQVSLVVLTLGGSDPSEALRVDAVSLNYVD